MNLVEHLMCEGVAVHVMYIDGDWLQMGQSAGVSATPAGALNA